MRNKIVFKLLSILTLIIVGINVLFLVFFDNLAYKQRKKDLNETIAIVKSLIKYGGAEALWNFDKTSLIELNKVILKKSDFIAINIFNFNKQKYFYTGLQKKHLFGYEEDATADSSVEYVVLENPFKPRKDLKGDKIYKISDDIVRSNQKIGSLDLFYTEKFMKQEIANTRLKLIYSFLLIILVLIIVIFVAIRILVINPILYLSEILSNIAIKKDFSIRIKKKQNDEIGILYSGFNNMLATIEKSTKELLESNMENENLKKYLANIIDAMPSMIVTIDTNGCITQHNRAFKHLILTYSDIIGKKLHEVSPEFKDFNMYRDVLRDGIQKEYRKQKFYAFPEKIFNMYFYPLFIDHEIKGIVIRIDDITEAEKKDMQIKQMQKMETVGILAGGLAHDFNNVLNGIVATLSIIDFKIKKNNNIEINELKNYLHIMRNSSDRASDMVKQLLMLSRKYEMTMLPIDLNLLLNNVVKICKNTFDKSISIKTKFWDKPALILGDETEIEQVLLNLAINASHAMTIMRKKNEKYGGALKFEIKCGKVDPTLRISEHIENDDDYWQIFISDTGIGMNEETISKIFTPFFTTKEKGIGTGLGLATSYNIIHQHKGIIDVKSQLGVGTTFILYFPVLKKSELISKDMQKIQSKIFKGDGKILVIDDERNILDVSKGMLTECGYEVLTAQSGKEGLNLYERLKDEIKLVVLDLVMPEMSGKEVFEELRKIDSKVTILLSSGFKMDERIKYLLNNGADGFLQKPYDIYKLSKAVYELLN